MPSLGAGFLALWNDHEQAGGDYDVWHTREHVAERLGIPGILSGRRYVDGSGSLSRYFTLYGLQNTAVLESDPYRQLLENPSPWSRQMRCSMSGFLRRGCRVLASYGGGVGGFAAVSFFQAEDEQKGKQILKDFRAHPAFTAVHLGLVDTSVTGVPFSLAGADRFDNRNAILVMEGYRPHHWRQPQRNYPGNCAAARFVRWKTVSPSINWHLHLTVKSASQCYPSDRVGSKEMMCPTDLRHVGSTGVRLSVPGVGTGSLANSGGADQFDSMIEAAWSGGLRHFDTAALYLNGESERRLGAAMRGKPREAYALSTKAGRYANESGSHFDYSRDGFMRSVEASLSRLQVDWLDIVMIHDLDPEHHGSGHAARMHEALDGACVALDMLRRRGVVRGVGVGSMNWLACLELARRFPIDCVMLAGGYTLLQQQSGELREYCRSHEISVMVASPFNSGILATGAVSDALYNYQPAGPHVLKRTRAIEAICRRYEVHIAAAALQFPLRHPAVTSVVAGHRAPEEITVNLERLRCPIPAAFWSEIAAETAGLEPFIF